MERVRALLQTNLIEPYQPQGVRWMLARETEPLVLFEESMPKGGIIADEVGLGKTILSISILLANPVSKTLVILPKSLVCQWEEQIQQFAPSLNVFVIRNMQSGYVEKDGVYLVSQSMLNGRNKIVGNSPVHDVHWGRVILDEAHVLRNKKSKFYEACSLLRTDIWWALTATPVMNRMTDFVNIMRMIGVSQYLCQGEKDAITNHFILRRTKQDVMTHNPSLAITDCHVQVQYIPFASIEEAEFYVKVFNTERKKIKNAFKNNTTDLLEHLLRVRQICIHPQLYLEGMTRKTGNDHGQWTFGSTKVDALLRSIREQPKQDKTLIFCQFVKEMDIYMDVLGREGYTCVRLDGHMNMFERERAVHRFQHEEDVTVFVIQINTGGQGINLQAANRIYIMSPNWNPAIEYQAIGRAHRTGQTKPVHVIKFCLASGDAKCPFIEENIMRLQDRKKNIIANILDDPRIVFDGVVHEKEPLGNGITAEDIRGLFNIYQHRACQ